jgi:hypothetical protein
MEFLVETFPFTFGVLLAFTCERLGGLRQHWRLAAGGSVALGAFATLASGEWRVSLAYFAFDIALVAATCAAANWLLVKRRDRLARK